MEVPFMADKEIIAKLRKKYMDSPPDGMTSIMVKDMSDNDLLDMDYFLHEDVFDEDESNGGFYIF
jgi:hypothetical protein